MATSGKIARAGPRDPSEAIRFCRMCFMTVTIIFSGGSEDTEEKRPYLGVAVVFIQGDWKQPLQPLLPLTGRPSRNSELIL